MYPPDYYGGENAVEIETPRPTYVPTPEDPLPESEHPRKDGPGGE